MPRLKRKSHEMRGKDNNLIKQRGRLDTEKKMEDQLRNSSMRRLRRQRIAVKTAEQALDTTRRRIRRQNPSIRIAEQTLDTPRRRLQRLKPSLKTSEQKRNTLGQRLRRKYVRLSMGKQEPKPLTLAENASKFLSLIKQGPTWTCTCCGGLWFRPSVSEVHINKLREKECTEEYLAQVLCCPVDSHGKIWLCFTCKRAVDKKKVPRLCLSNGLHFPEIPPILQDLTSLEERLCALRLPFLQIRSLGVDQQCGLRGNVVHIPNNVDEAVKFLPRNLNDADIIPVQLMRRMEHDHPYIFQNIRPQIIFKAIQYLAQTPLYIQEKVVISEDWLRDVEKQLQDATDSKCESQMQVDEAEAEEDVNPGGHETMIFNDGSTVLKIAPGEGKRPMSITADVHCEEASYPTIYGGIPRKFKVMLSYTELAKSETRRFDRRCAQPHKLLHAFKISQNHQVLSAISLCLRKKKGNVAVASDLLNPETVGKIVAHDVGFHLLKQIRTSPAYWEQKTKHILAMIRQLGIPTLFLTISAAETHWPDLLINLKKILDGITLTEEQVMALSYEQKASLIRRDPVTCARYFDYRLRQAFNNLLKPENSIFGPYKLKDFYSRIEFQHRGSPHAHMLLWLNNAPVYDESDESSVDLVNNFVDGLISCENGMEGVIHQQHRHTRTCKRQTKVGVVCRFNIPYPPMEKTMIIQPFPSTFPSMLRKKHSENLIKIKLFVEENHKASPDKPLSEMLLTLKMSNEDYQSAVRSSIKRPTIFLKRNLGSCFTNAFIPSLAKVWKSNMDVQFILEPYGCAKYISSYISKSAGGVSKLLKAATDEMARGNLNLTEKFRKLGNTFLNYSEISAQESAYGVLGLPLTKSSRSVIFIPTGLPDERVHLVKSKKELEALCKDSTEVYVLGLLDHYINRPDELDELCLASFASTYTFFSKKKEGKNEECKDLEDEDCEVDDDPGTTKVYALKNGGFIRERMTERVIRFRKYDHQLEPENFYREQLMLFTPWRDEQSEIVNIDRHASYEAKRELIKEKFTHFNAISVDLLSSEITEDSDTDDSSIEIDKEYEAMYDEFIQADIMQELNPELEDKLSVERIPSVDFCSPEEYKAMILQLNDRQVQYVCHVLESLRSGIFITDFLYGGAGVGKSTVIDAIVQCVLRLTATAGSDPSTPKVLLCGPTGQSAFQIHGATLHHTFLLPLTQFSGPLPPLSADMCNTLACSLRDLKLLVIDEISMVSCTQLYYVNARLQQIFKKNEKFGGISTMVVGDLRQLKPVAAEYVFSNIKGELGKLLGNPIWEEMASFELTEIMRQKDDKVFAEALNRLSRGALTDDDIVMFKSREIRNAGEPPVDAIRLFAWNEQVNNYNTITLAMKNTERAESVAVDSCGGKGKAKNKAALLASVAQLKTKDAMGLPYIVPLVVEAKYMMTLNVDVRDGLTNGANGVLKKLSYAQLPDGRKIPTIAWLKFKNNTIGLRKRNLIKHKRKVPADLVPVILERRIIKRWPGRELHAIRMQLPLVPAEAKTFYKAQGDSYDDVVVGLKGATCRALYVGCSRARTLNGLYFDGEFVAPGIAPNDQVEAALKLVKDREIAIPSYASPHQLLLEIKAVVTEVSNTARSSNYDSKTFISTKPSKKKLKKRTTSPQPTNGNPFIKQLGAASIFNNDIQTLRRWKWLSDAIIDGFMEILHQVSSGHLRKLWHFGSHFIHYLWTHPDIDAINWINQTSREVLVFPKCNNVHWWVIVADRSTRKITRYDSQNNHYDADDTLIIMNFLELTDAVAGRAETNWTVQNFIFSDGMKQTNGCDCGVYLCAIVDYLVRRQEFDFEPASMYLIRNVIRNRILQHVMI